MRFLLHRLGPWAWPLIIAQVLLVIYRHLKVTSPEDRARVQELVRKAGGQRGNLTKAERRELWQALHRMRPSRLVRDIAFNVVRPGRSALRKRP